MGINWKVWIPGIFVLAVGLFARFIDWRDVIIVLLLVIVIHVLLPLITRRK